MLEIKKGKMKLLMICGSYPPEHCGVGDYTKQLVENLRKLDIDVETLVNINWSLPAYFKIVKRIKSFKADVIHIQYPSMNFGYSIVPQLLCLRFNTFVTIHEVSQSRIPRKISLLPFSFAKKCVFTNTFELKAFKKLFPWINKSKLSVIPIGSAIKMGIDLDINQKDKTNIVSFGLIRPDKGLEDVVVLAQLLKENNLQFKVTIVGQLLEKYTEYYQDLVEKTSSLNVSWLLNKTDIEISQILSQNLISYLPYPDGVSQRRSSLFAVFSNKMLVFTTFGFQTTPELAECVIEVKTPQDLISIISEDKNLSFTSAKIKSVEDYMENISWDKIASKHLMLYNRS
ncbi:hypothetical protein ACEN2P_17725 [Pedobacter psychrotolerans]|uniref:hypothetical protein n=1 Tax=Pedobacter psychrotolerans TaxID=1843235 RepID=UPI003F96C3D5